MGKVIFFFIRASTYNSCSNCSGRCSATCGIPTTNMCSSSACVGGPTCINQSAITHACNGSASGCSSTYCFNSCGLNACASMCSDKSCNGLATIVFNFLYYI